MCFKPILFFHSTELSSFSGQPQDVTATQGGTVSFQCSIEGTPKPRVTWERNQQPLPQSDRCVFVHAKFSRNNRFQFCQLFIWHRHRVDRIVVGSK